MPVASVAELSAALRAHGLLESAQLEELAGLCAQFSQPGDLAADLLRRGWLTSYQVEQLLQERGRELLLGSYVLLEPIGEGGMGQVFKAKNWKLGKLVALKVIRKERLQKPDAVRRFQREIRAASQLSHPHVVMAHDADEIDGTHFFAMEYVDGIDLARLLKQSGPLPAPIACEYVRQAALGLQHAHEKGLVHRDIKPSNLLLQNVKAGTTVIGPTVKLLDLGLARFLDGSEESSTTLTESGAVMGTPDYIAPEQALGSHHVDIRADLYSLGGTLYFLLTGQVPFPGGTVGEKIAKHLTQEPEPVEKLCADIPPGVATLVRKLMAKHPSDRYQTPGELAAVIEEGLRTGNWPPPAPTQAIQVAPLAFGPVTGPVPLASPVAATELGSGVSTPWSGLLNEPTNPNVQYNSLGCRHRESHTIMAIRRDQLARVRRE